MKYRTAKKRLNRYWRKDVKAFDTTDRGKYARALVKKFYASELLTSIPDKYVEHYWREAMERI